MFRTTPYLNKQIRRKEEERNRNFHLQHLKQIRPSTGGIIPDEETHVLNNRKREQLMENRFTEIERENRILLEKITGIMGQRPRHRKRGTSLFVNTKDSKDPKSLNVTFRKRQYQEIEIENAKLLKRLQEKKSEYQVDKMKKDWKRQRYVIRNISNYPMEKKRRDRSSETGLYQRFQRDTRTAQPNVEVNRVKSITGHSFVVNLKLDSTKLTITAVLQGKLADTEPKVIEIPREEAMEFIAEECNNRIELLFQMLYYDGDTLFLIGQGEQDAEQQERKQGSSQAPVQPEPPRAPARKQSPEEVEIPIRSITEHKRTEKEDDAVQLGVQQGLQQSENDEHQIKQKSLQHQGESQEYHEDNPGESVEDVPVNRLKEGTPTFQEAPDKPELEMEPLAD